METFDAEEWLALAQVDLQRGLFEQALGKLKRALAQPQCPPQVQLETARAYAQLGLRTRAHGLFKSYLAQRPKDFEARFQHGVLLFDDGRTDAASEAWDDALREAPSFAPAQFYRALACARTGARTEAVRRLEALLRTVATDSPWLQRGRELLAQLQPPPGRAATAAAVAVAS